MPRTPLQYKKMKDERMLSILEASLPLFAIYGEQKISVDMICAKANCSHGLVYHYFKDVHEIYEIIINSDTYLELRTKIFAPRKGQYAIKSIEEITSITLKKAGEDISLLSLIVIILNETGKSSFKNLLEQYVKQGQKEGDVVGGDPGDIVDVFIAMLQGLYIPKIINKKYIINIPSLDTTMRIFSKRA